MRTVPNLTQNFIQGHPEAVHRPHQVDVFGGAFRVSDHARQRDELFQLVGRSLTAIQANRSVCQC